MSLSPHVSVCILLGLAATAAACGSQVDPKGDAPPEVATSSSAATGGEGAVGGLGGADAVGEGGAGVGGEAVSCPFEEVGSDYATFAKRHTTVSPASTDPTVTWQLPGKHHVVMTPEHRAPRSELFVHFVGSGGSPSGGTNILTAATYAGYRSISLAYPNEPSIGTRCSDKPESCLHLTRQEVLTGEDVSPDVEVDVDNSAENRLLLLLSYLDQQEPDEGWGGFVDDDGHIDWSSIVVSGFSQGGGMVGLLSTEHEVARAIHFSKAADSVGAAGAACTTDEQCAESPCVMPDGACLEVVPATWAEFPRATPPNRVFAIVHARERAMFHTPETLTLWGVDELGPFVDTDTSEPPYGCTHQLSTDLEPRGNGDFHGSTGSNHAQPLDADGVPEKLPAWLYMLTAPL